MLLERHNTHAMSSHNSSSKNHSYDSEIFEKKINNIKQNDEKEISINSQLTKLQLNKINDILSKYNLASDRSKKKESSKDTNRQLEHHYSERKGFQKPIKSIATMNGEVQSMTRKKKKKTTFRKKSDLDVTKQINSNISNANINNNNNTNMSNLTHSGSNKEKKEENKINDIIYNNNRYGKFSEITKLDNKKKDLIYAISYKKINRETRFNNIQKYLKEENKIQQKLKNEKKHKLLMYQQMLNSRNLLRSINKPKISFITKEQKNFGKYYSRYEMFSEIRLNVKNNFCFFTKKIIRQDEYIVIEKQMKIQKYEKLKKEVEEEKIPTFSSIDTSSSNSIGKVKAKGKSKTKSKSKKKTNKYKTKIKPKNLTKKKKTLLPKYNKLRSISVHSKISNEKSEDRKTITSRMNINQKIPNMKKKNSNSKYDRKSIGINKENRKFSMISRFHDRFANKKKNEDKNKIASSSSIRNMQQFNSPFKNNLKNINKLTEEDKNKLNNSGNKDKDKEMNELDFKKFLEEQKIKRSNQIRNFIKKQGMNSYNFFYPKEPSPLLGIFKKNCSVYPTLNLNRRSIIEDEKRYMRLKNDMNYSPINHGIKKGSQSYRKEKIYLKEIKEKRNNDELKEINKIHLIEKHYGNEKDCPICRTFKMKEEETEMNFMKTTKYNKLRVMDKNSGMFSPNSTTSVNTKNDFAMMSRNRINSSKKSLNENESAQIKKNFNVLFDYFMQ